MKYLLTYIMAVVILAALDFTWFTFISKDFYSARIGQFYAPNVNFFAGALFYLFYAAALMYFVVSPAHGSLSRAALTGAFLGFTAFMTFDLTAQATFKDWPVSITVVDIGWGMFASTVVSTIATLIL